LTFVTHPTRSIKEFLREFSQKMKILLFLLSPCLTSGLSAPVPNQYPASIRQALIKKSQELGQSKGCYSTVGWSNRFGSVLTPAATSVSTADRPFYWNNIDVGCRMTIVELPRKDGDSKSDLWIHSPVALDGPLQALLQDLGTVRYVVSPNYEHIKFASQWALAYPHAELWACPGLRQKVPNTGWTHEIPFGVRSLELWPGILALHSDCEVNPFTGEPFFNEVVFYHVSSKTLLTTDLYWNYPSNDGVTNSHLRDDEISGPWELAPPVDSVPIGSKLWKLGMDQVYRPFFKSLMVKDKDAYNEIVKIILDTWDVETLIPAHGDILRGKKIIQEVLGRHFK
jgi:Domain of unknown function (DUF4336)